MREGNKERGFWREGTWGGYVKMRIYLSNMGLGFHHEGVLG